MITEGNNGPMGTGQDDDQSQQQPSTQKQDKKVHLLPEDIRTYLQSDQEKLKESREQARKANNQALVASLTRRLTHYRFASPKESSRPVVSLSEIRIM